MSGEQPQQAMRPGIYLEHRGHPTTPQAARRRTARGSTANFDVSFDGSLGSPGATLADGLLATCESDYRSCYTDFFGLSSAPSGGKYSLSIIPGAMGASHGSCGDRNISIDAFTVIDVELTRMLMMAEVSEVLMAVVGNWDCGASTGEALSRIVSFEFHPDPGSSEAAGFLTASTWLKGARPDFVTTTDPTDLNFESIGCATLFLYFLRYQLGFSWNAIVQAGGPTLAETFQNLTGRTSGLTEFMRAINTLFPPATTLPSMKTDNPFPIPVLRDISCSPPNIVVGQNTAAKVSLTQRFPAFDLTLAVTSDMPMVATVPSPATVTAGASSVAFPVTCSVPISGPLVTTNISATLFGTTVSGPLVVRQPALTSLVLTPTQVLAGQFANATVTMEAPYPDPITLFVTTGSPGFATVPAAPVVVLANQTAVSFVVTTPPIQVPFSPAKVDIIATYGGGSASAVLQVLPTVVAGTLSTLHLNPPSVHSGGQTTGVVTLLAAVPTDTTVGLAALEPGHGPLGAPSSLATVPPQITIPAGATQGTFAIQTNHISPQATVRTATIMAVAVVSKEARLTLT